MIDEFTYSSENLLYHFCSVLRGSMGFKLARENMQDLIARESLDEEAVLYMAKILEMLPKSRQCPSNVQHCYIPGWLM